MFKICLRIFKISAKKKFFKIKGRVTFESLYIERGVRLKKELTIIIPTYTDSFEKINRTL